MTALLAALAVSVVVGIGLMAGLFFMASVALMPALTRRPAPEAIAAMQALNRAILNPLFLAVFVGTGLLAVPLALTGPVVGAPGWVWSTTGATLYLAGGVGVTVLVNVPMNDALDAVDAHSEAGQRAWGDYAVRWTRWNHARTVACTAGVAASGVGLLVGCP